MAKVTTMKNNLYKGAAIGLIALSAFPLFAAAQSYSPYSYPSTSCSALTAYQQLGSRDAFTGGQVTILQQFLNRTGYLNGVTGAFDVGTYGAVVNFQRGHGISPTGTVGPLTRASINQQNCSGSYSNPSSGQYPNSAYQAAPYITSLSMSSATAGTSVTLYGSNFAGTNTLVHFGGSTISASSLTDSALTFIVPYVSTGTYQISVSNAYGSSNSMSFNILNSSLNSSNSNCAWYGNTYQCGCQTTYTNGYSSTNNCSSTGNTTINSGTWFGEGAQPRISGVSGQGTVSTGSSNTWSVASYSQNNLPVSVRVDWGDGTQQQSTQGGSVSQSYPFSHSYSSSGSYTIRFTATDSNGAYAYSTLPVSVYGSSYNNNYNYTSNANYPSISSLSSSSGYRGSTITIFGSNFGTSPTVNLSNANGNYGYATGNSYNSGTSFSFVIPYISTGTYNLSVSNASGQSSNSLSFTVY